MGEREETEHHTYGPRHLLGGRHGHSLGVPYFTAHRALVVKANAQMGETVFIHGARCGSTKGMGIWADLLGRTPHRVSGIHPCWLPCVCSSGGVGTAAIQLARARGLRVIGSAGSPAGLDLVRAQGAHEVVDHRQPDHMEHVKALTGAAGWSESVDEGARADASDAHPRWRGPTDGKGPQIILEMLANENLGADLKLAANFGRVIVVGSRGLTTVDPRDIMLRELTVTAVFMFHATQEEMVRAHATGVRWQASPNPWQAASACSLALSGRRRRPRPSRRTSKPAT